LSGIQKVILLQVPARIHWETFRFQNSLGGPYTFIFSGVGYETQTLSGYNIKNDVTLSLMIKMKEMSSNLDNVVVVGYGTTKRKDLTGSVASLGNKEIKDLALPRIEQALSGRVAGVQVKYADGSPGGAPQIRVRGVRKYFCGS
jgi:hypothetical protein